MRTPSFDMETAAHEWRDSSAITEQKIKETAQSYIGKQLQVPPMYSAVKYGGNRYTNMHEPESSRTR